jgi:ABC-type Fe3+-hydroxamate transport system substrate-binding protein
VPALERLPERINAIRIVATPAALDAIAWPAGALALRIAPDEAIITADVKPDAILIHDPHAIVVAESGFAAAWIAADEALDFLEHACEWELPRERPAFAQGAVAGLPVKLWLEQDRVLFLVPAPFAIDLKERMA